MEVFACRFAYRKLTAASRANGLTERVGELTLPVLVITGDDDRIVPTAQSEPLAEKLPNDELLVMTAA